jgi:hypothetical protein
MEMAISYIQDGVIKEAIGKEYKPFSSYLLTVFFFILINNLIGIIPVFPGGASFGCFLYQWAVRRTMKSKRPQLRNSPQTFLVNEKSIGRTSSPALFFSTTFPACSPSPAI